MKLIRLSFLVLIAFGCQQSQTTQDTTETATPYKTLEHHSDLLTKAFDAHGGYEKWSQMQSMTYLRGEETTVTNLWNRKIRLESPTQTIGFDGDEVWMAPDSLDASRARFFHNLFFYFYAMPFVVGDPGAYYENVESKELNGKTYNGIKVSYNEGVGDAPDDNYILWLDQETNKMEWLMYTVTYRSGEPSDRYSLIKYDGWKEFSGLLLPTSLQWFKYDGESVGESRGDATIFENVQVSETPPDESLFVIPEGAQIAPR